VLQLKIHVLLVSAMTVLCVMAIFGVSLWSFVTLWSWQT
jgi:hypothetical protein